MFDSAFLAGVFAEGGARPIIAENTFSGGDVNSQVEHIYSIPSALAVVQQDDMKKKINCTRII